MEASKFLPDDKKFFYQNDKRWKDIQMVDTRPYTLGSHGCLITSLTNAYNDFNREHAECKGASHTVTEGACKSCYLPYTPDMMLGLLKQHKAINEDGLVLWVEAEKALNMEAEPFCKAPDPYFAYHIVQFINFGSAHFSNVIKILENGEIMVYNVYSGRCQELLPNQVHRWVNLRFYG